MQHSKMQHSKMQHSKMQHSKMQQTLFGVYADIILGYKIDAERRSEKGYFLALFSLYEKQNCTTLRIGHQFAATVKNVVWICVLQRFVDIGLSARSRKNVRAKLSQFQINVSNL